MSELYGKGWTTISESGRVEAFTRKHIRQPVVERNVCNTLLILSGYCAGTA